MAVVLEKHEQRPEQRIEVILATDSHIEAVSIGDEGNVCEDLRRHVLGSATFIFVILKSFSHRRHR